MSQNLQEKICPRVSFLMKLKADSNYDTSGQFCKLFVNFWNYGCVKGEKSQHQEPTSTGDHPFSK